MQKMKERGWMALIGIFLSVLAAACGGTDDGFETSEAAVVSCNLSSVHGTSLLPATVPGLQMHTCLANGSCTPITEYSEDGCVPLNGDTWQFWLGLSTNGNKVLVRQGGVTGRDFRVTNNSQIRNIRVGFEQVAGVFYSTPTVILPGQTRDVYGPTGVIPVVSKFRAEIVTPPENNWNGLLPIQVLLID